MAEPAEAPIVAPLRARYPRLASLGGRVPDIVLLVVLSFAVFVNFNPDEPPKWTWFYTNGMVHAYVDANYSYDGVRQSLAANRSVVASNLSAAGRPLYIWTVALAHGLGHVPIESVYPWLNWIFFTLTVGVVYVLCATDYGM